MRGGETSRLEYAITHRKVPTILRNDQEIQLRLLSQRYVVNTWIGVARILWFFYATTHRNDLLVQVVRLDSPLLLLTYHDCLKLWFYLSGLRAELPALLSVQLNYILWQVLDLIPHNFHHVLLARSHRIGSIPHFFWRHSLEALNRRGSHRRGNHWATTEPVQPVCLVWRCQIFKLLAGLTRWARRINYALNFLIHRWIHHHQWKVWLEANLNFGFI